MEKKTTIKFMSNFKNASIYLILFLLSFSTANYATTYYVRSATGSDSNDGLSVNTAFQSLKKLLSGNSIIEDGDVIDISGTFENSATYKIVKNITIQGTDKSTCIFQGTEGSKKNCFIIGSASIGATPSVVIENVTFQDFDYWSNDVSNNGGAINVIGASSLTCRKVVFKNNKAYGGGAVNMNAGTGVFEDCYFFNNIAKQRTGAANAHGGAISVSTAAALNISLTIDRCLFEGNTAENTGPAIRFVAAGTGNTTLLVQNSTFTGNIVKLPSAATNSGALTLSISSTGTNDVKLVHNTIAYNSSEVSGSTANGLFIGGVTDNVLVINNIIYSNTSPDNSDNSISTASGVKMKESRNNITSQAFKFVSKTTNAETMSSGNISSVSVSDIGLAKELALNGGETKTLAIEEKSIAVNGGFSKDAPKVDQRGLKRNTLPDVGAFEFLKNKK
jgi:hypothetical protein